MDGMVEQLLTKIEDAPRIWYLMSPAQKRQHLFVDSPEITKRHVSLLLRTYGETEESLYQDQTEAN